MLFPMLHNFTWIYTHIEIRCTLPSYFCFNVLHWLPLFYIVNFPWVVCNKILLGVLNAHNLVRCGRMLAGQEAEGWSLKDKCSTDGTEGQTDSVYSTGGCERWAVCNRVARVDWLNQLADSPHFTLAEVWHAWSDASNQLAVEVHRDCGSTQSLWSRCSSMRGFRRLVPPWWPTGVFTLWA